MPHAINKLGQTVYLDQKKRCRGVTLRRGPSRRRVRDIVIIRMADSGWTLDEVAAVFKLSTAHIKTRHKTATRAMRAAGSPITGSIAASFRWPERERRSARTIKSYLPDLCCELMAHGFTITDIASVFQINVTTARRWIKKSGLAIDPSRSEHSETGTDPVRDSVVVP